MLASAQPIAASTAPAAEQVIPDVEPSGLKISVPSSLSASAHMWVWSQGSRGYLLTDPDISMSSFGAITAFDLETGVEIASEELTPPANGGLLLSSSKVGVGRNMLVSVDEAGGRLFVATQNPTLGGADSVGPVANAHGSSAAQGRTCAHITMLGCFGGISVLDAASLETVGKMAFRSVSGSETVLSPQLMAMEFAGATPAQPEKVHVLLREWTHGPSNSDALGLFQPKRVAPEQTFLVQFDPAKGVQDWMIRVDACRGGRIGTRSGDTAALLGLSDEAAILRGPDTDMALYVACNFDTQSLSAGVVRIPLDDQGRPSGQFHAANTQSANPGAAATDAPNLEALDEAEMPGNGQASVEGPDRIYQMIGDPEAGRFYFQVVDGNPRAIVWWVFDTAVMRFIGTIGIGGPVDWHTTMSGFSRETGRLYVLAASRSGAGRNFPGGLFVTDARRSPVAQALHYPQLEAQYPTVFGNVPFRHSLVPQALEDGRVRLWHVDATGQSRKQYQTIIDQRPLQASVLDDEFADRTLDLDEMDGVTSASLDGAARGYGVRAVLVSGVEAAARMGPIDPLGMIDQCNDSSWGNDVRQDEALAIADAALHGAGTTSAQSPQQRGYGGAPCRILGVSLPNSCTRADREVILAAAGPDDPAILDQAGARGAAQPFVVDSGTIADSQTLVSRCTATDWEKAWATALFGRPPIAEPAPGLGAHDRIAACTSGSRQTAQRVGDPVLDGYSAEASCEHGESRGYAYTRGGTVDGIGVGEAVSSYRIYRDPHRGVVARVESVARGLSLDGLVHINSVRGTAESWANGRTQPVSVQQREDGYVANCDYERTAGTCFRRHLFGLWTPGYTCGPCGDENAFVGAINAVFRPYASATLREPDQGLARGAENGFAAAIQKSETDRFADLVLNNDLLQTVLPTLEFIRTAPPNRFPTRQGSRGRQIYQFAGVEVSSSYGIQCLLVYDEATNTCAAEREVPGSLTVSLADGEGAPLAGGAFEVRKDVDADGVVGLVDTLLPDGACVTAEDGIGTCTFENLQPGSYLVTQTAAPTGFAKVDDTWVSEVASGEARTVAFTNTSNVSTIDVSAVDEDGKPISGAVFAVYPDPDADGKIAADAQPAATCTTNDQGACSMSVPVGSYVLVQTSAPAGLEGIEPVAFAFASGGQTAAVGVTNYGAGVPDVAPAAGPVYTEPVNYSPPVETVTDYTPPIVDEPKISVPEKVGSTVVKVIQAPGDVLRLLSRDPQQAAAWLATLIIFFIAAAAIHRRRGLTSLRLNRNNEFK